MTTIILIDCLKVREGSDFYPLFAAQAQLDTHFGANLDALWDVLTANLPLPTVIRFVHFQSTLHAQPLKPIIMLIEEAVIELHGALRLELIALKN